jgi:4-diphosphocytidyl-2-C-methyl-D-erythritol kinase
VQIRRSVFGIEVLAAAKVNIFFEVLSRRDDGFHEIESLMVPIGLYDTLILEDDPSGQVSLTARWATGYQRQSLTNTGHASEISDQFGDLPEAENNLAVRAVRLLAQYARINRGAKLQLIKRIPAAAGLGGGSSDAAAALLAANIVWKLNWSVSRLQDIAAELGSDVPFFLTGCPAICRGRGEKIEPVVGMPFLHFVIVRPPEGLATAQVYQACRPGLPPRQVGEVVESLRQGSLAAIGPMAHNRLLEPARTQSTWIDKLIKMLKSENCPAIGMSGSGSSCFAICRSALQARRLAARLRNRCPGIGKVWAVSSI